MLIQLLPVCCRYARRGIRNLARLRIVGRPSYWQRVIYHFEPLTYCCQANSLPLERSRFSSTAFQVCSAVARERIRRKRPVVVRQPSVAHNFRAHDRRIRHLRWCVAEGRTARTGPIRQRRVSLQKVPDSIFCCRGQTPALSACPFLRSNFGDGRVHALRGFPASLEFA